MSADEALQAMELAEKTRRMESANKEGQCFFEESSFSMTQRT